MKSSWRKTFPNYLISFAASSSIELIELKNVTVFLSLELHYLDRFFIATRSNELSRCSSGGFGESTVPFSTSFAWSTRIPYSASLPALRPRRQLSRCGLSALGLTLERCCQATFEANFFHWYRDPAKESFFSLMKIAHSIGVYDVRITFSSAVSFIGLLSETKRKALIFLLREDFSIFFCKAEYFLSRVALGWLLRLFFTIDCLRFSDEWGCWHSKSFHFIAFLDILKFPSSKFVWLRVQFRCQCVYLS